LCADTQETIAGYVKTDTEKMRVVSFPLYNVAITGAGDGDLIEMLTDEIVDALTRDKPTAALWPIMSDLIDLLYQVEC